MVRVYYFPFAELIGFLISLTVLGAAFYLGFSLWLILIVFLVAYFVTLGNSFIIKLTDKELILFSLNPFSKSHWIDSTSILRINSEESYTLESDVTVEVAYPIFRRKYLLEYLDKKNEKRLVYFSIHSETKAKKIFEALKISKQS